MASPAYEFEQSTGDGKGQQSLASCSPWDHKEFDTTEQQQPSGKGGDGETMEEQSRNNNAALRQGPDSSSKDTHKGIFQLFTELKSPTNGKC